MSLKPQPDRPAIAVPAPPAWGILAEPGEAVSSIRFECVDGAYSYPYHALARWVLRAGKPEMLVIRAGADEVAVRGRELVPVRDALERGRLRVLSVASERYVGAKSGTAITHLSIEPLKSTD